MIITALIFFLVLSILVFIHELGHYLVARFVGVHVEEFGFGLPPRLFGKKFGKTIYSLNWLPIGGFVKLAGEDTEDEDKKVLQKKDKKHTDEYFWAKSKKQRAAILVAGVTMNLLLSWSITTFLLTQGVVEPTKTVRVDTVAPESPAAVAGILEKDIITDVQYVVDGTKKTQVITNPDELISTIKAHAGEEVVIAVLREKRPLVFALTPRKNPPAGQGALGVAINNLEEKKYPLYEAPFVAAKINGVRMYQMVSSLGDLVKRLVTGAKVGRDEVAGPIGIAKVTGEARKYGWKAVMEFMGILSLNLAVINVLPLPALDGGRLMFVVFEKFGRKTKPELERLIHQIGMVVLLLLVALVSVNDIIRLLGK